MQELAGEYKQSVEKLKERVAELARQKDFVSARTAHPEKDPEVAGLADRLRPLRTMLQELREVAREVEHYYDRSWWRSEEYTLNQRRAGKFVYAGPTR